jgi:hypothetical protein
VFFISLPFTALYAALITTGIALAVGPDRVSRPEIWLAASAGAAATASGVIAWRDARAARRGPAAAPGESGTIPGVAPR